MRIRGMLAIVGLFGLLLGVSLSLSRAQVVANALARDGVDVGDPLGNDTEERLLCRRPLVSVDLADRVMSEDDEQALTVVVGNQVDEVACVVNVQLAALRFDVSPPALSQTSMELASGETQSFVWLIAPRRTGEHTIIVTANEELRSLGVTVRTWLGLTAGQARVASWLATLLGPVLTLPWWLERWEKRRRPAGTPPAPA